MITGFRVALFLLPLLAQHSREPAVDDVTALRAEGPAALQRLCDRYDTLESGIERDSLERTIDAVAAQRYASVSRLYWYTDLDLARTAARAHGRPILSLRMLGRLDEDFSCANSRFFRIVLYADPTVSRFLRENFVLHWSRERPVPRVTIEFGDGRRIDTTLAGNSAHYVLDADGRPLDLLPGLYSPVAFRRELEAVLPLARSSPRLSEEGRLAYVREHHVERLRAAASLWGESTDVHAVLPGSQPGILDAESRAVAKSVAETRTRVAARLGGELESVLTVRRLEEARLSGRSRELLVRLGPIDWAKAPCPLEGDAFEEAVAGFEALVAADTERNEMRLRASVHEWFTLFAVLPDFESLNDFVYREIFRTPREDRWLGLANPGTITGLPRDGVTE